MVSISNHHHTFMNSIYTERQGQFPAYIHQYSLVNGRAPAEADMQRFFQVTPPSVHSMVLTLERRGWIRRLPGQARSITLIISPESLPLLKRVQPGPFKHEKRSQKTWLPDLVLERKSVNQLLGKPVVSFVAGWSEWGSMIFSPAISLKCLLFIEDN